jgi:SAM-dependent methyltransferase
MTADTNDRVKELWQSRAREPGVNDREVTHRDVWQRWLEIEMIRRFLLPGDRLLDVGCGNGYTTRAVAPLVRETVGLDFSPEMIERARRTVVDTAPNLRFEVCDVRSLEAAQLGQFDVALSERCLINLPDWEAQQQAIANIAAVVRAGGRLIFVEGSADGRQRLNEMRERVGLERMPTVWHNVDFEERLLLPCLERFFAIDERLHFGVYDFIARIVHPLVAAPEPPAYDSRINEVAARLAMQSGEFADLSRVFFLVLRRKAA